MKKLISVFLAVLMSLMLAAPALATDNSSYHVTHDDSEVRIAEEYIDGIKYIYTFNKSSQVLLTQTFDSNDILTSTKTICISDIEIASYEDSPQPFANSHYQHTFLNYEYDQIADNMYQLRNKDLYVLRYLPQDRDAINDYVSAVDTLNAAELAVIASGGATAIWAIATYLTAGLTTGEVATTVGVAVADVIALNLAIDNCERSWELYVDQ